MRPFVICAILQNFHFTLDTNKLQLLGWTVAVVKEELLTRLNGTFGKDTNAMIAVYHDDLCIAVGIYRMICEANFVALASRVDDKVIVEIEQEAARVLIVDFSTTIGFVLRDDFTAIFLF